MSQEHDQQKNTMPKHLGLILDGNRRWAKENGLPQLEGHRRGYENLKKIAEAVFDRGIPYLSAYVFSTENWTRSQEEVAYLMDLLYWVATSEVNEIHKKNIRVRFLGSRERLSPKHLRAIDAALAKTAENDRGQLALCLNYGGHMEIAEAVAAIVEEKVRPEEITPEVIARHLYAPDIPPVDLLIRTSGEQRISNFMLWRAAYSELLFVDKHWPAFSEDDLDAALADFANRHRRFGR